MAFYDVRSLDNICERDGVMVRCFGVEGETARVWETRRFD